MLVKNLTAICKLAGRISNPSSLTNLYRSIQLDNTTARVNSEFGNMEIKMEEETGLSKPRLLQLKDLSAVKELPQNSEIIFTEKENHLAWKCGSASGKWNFVFADYSIPQIDHKDFPWTPPDNLATALRLASAACQSASLSVGLYGLSIEVVGEELYLMSCNSVSLAATRIAKGSFPIDKIVLRPPVPEIIAALVGECPGCKLDITDEGIFIDGGWLKAQLPFGQKLDQDLKKIYDKWTTSAQHTAKIDSGVIKKFIARARILSDKHTSFTISMKIVDGKLLLSHSGISSSSEEFFICEGLDPSISFTSSQEVEEGEENRGIALEAVLILVALSFVDEAIFDYLPQNTLVLRGNDPNYCYVLGGGQ
jgi:hypothetical protein